MVKFMGLARYEIRRSAGREPLGRLLMKMVISTVRNHPGRIPAFTCIPCAIPGHRHHGDLASKTLLGCLDSTARHEARTQIGRRSSLLQDL